MKLKPEINTINHPEISLDALMARNWLLQGKPITKPFEDPFLEDHRQEWLERQSLEHVEGLQVGIDFVADFVLHRQ